MAQYSIVAPDGHTYQVEGPEGATDEQVRAEVLRQNPQAAEPVAPTEQPASKGILARGYDAVGRAGASVAGKGHDLAAPLRAGADYLAAQLPEALTRHRLADEGAAPTRADAERQGQTVAQDIAPMLASVLATGGLGAAARAGATGLRAGPVATRLATTGGQVAGGATSGAGAAEATGRDPLAGGIAGGLAGAVPGAAPALGRAVVGGIKGAIQAGPRALENIWGGPMVKDALKGAWQGLRGQPANPLVNMGPARVPPAPSSGMVTSTGQASAGASGQPSALLTQTQPVKPTVRFGPGGIRPGGSGANPALPVPAPPARPSDLPMTRAHRPAEPIMNLPPPGPQTGMPPASGTADILRRDPTLQSALDVARQWGNQRRKGFAMGGLVGEDEGLLASILRRRRVG